MSSPSVSRIVLPHHLTLPVEFYCNLPFLRGEMNGQPCLMLLDSGAPNITLNAARIPDDQLVRSGELMGASGKVNSYRTRFEELKFGEWSMGPMEVLALVETALEEAFGVEYQGLSGFQQLINYDWMLDYDACELHLWTYFHKEEHRIREEVRIRYLNHLPILEVEIAGQTFRLLLDTGASGIVFDIAKARMLESVISDHNDDELQGAGGNKIAVSGGTLEAFQVGEIEFGAADVKFSDISALTSRLGDFDGIIGYSLLSQARVVVSWGQRHLYILE